MTDKKLEEAAEHYIKVHSFTVREYPQGIFKAGALFERERLLGLLRTPGARMADPRYFEGQCHLIADWLSNQLKEQG